MFKVGDKVKIKRTLPDTSVREKGKFCGKEFTVIEILDGHRYHYVLNDAEGYGWEEAEFEVPLNEKQREILHSVVVKVVKETERILFEGLIAAHEERIKLWKEHLEKL